jgi:hypothetical protein
MKQGAPLGHILDAVKQAGHQLVSDGKMKDETLAIVSSEIIPRDEVIKIMTQSYGDK